MKGAVVLLSGGMDSSTLLHYVKGRLAVASVHALSFDYGQKHSRELEAAAWQAENAGVERHEVIDVSFIKELVARGSALTDERVEVPRLACLGSEQRRQPPTYVPNRNMILLSLAAAYAESHGLCDLFYGAQAQDEYGYWDCTRKFLDGINKVLSLNRRQPVTVHAPFIGMRKAEVLKLGLELGVDFGRTWSCYRGGARPCDACPTCVERAKAFRELAVGDPLAAADAV